MITNKNFISDADILKMHNNSLKILNQVGVKIPNKKILDLFKKLNCYVLNFSQTYQ